LQPRFSIQKQRSSFYWTPEHFKAVIEAASLICGLISFVVVALVNWKRGRKFNAVWASALAGAGIPTGLAVVTCAFVRSLVPVLADLNLYLGITGASLIYLSIEALIEAAGKIKALLTLSGPPESTSGAVVTFFATVATLAPGTPGGPVVFKDGSTELGTVNVQCRCIGLGNFHHYTVG
jgi:hypothetical protein